MHIPISKRLLACARLVPKGASVYDVGCDHGYLGIYLLANGLARHVVASDLREKPLQRARENAARFGTADRMDFVCCDGLAAMDGTQGDTLVIAGMGGDAMAGILKACPWSREPGYTCILQPQSSGNDLRRYLGQTGYRIERETLVQDGGFVYTALLCRYGGGAELTPGQQYVSPQLQQQPGPLLDKYMGHVLKGLQKAVDGIRASSRPEDAERLPYYETALQEVMEMREEYEHGTGRAESAGAAGSGGV